MSSPPVSTVGPAAPGELRPKPWLIYGFYPLAGLLVFAVLAAWSADAFDDVLLVFTAAPSIATGSVVTTGLAFHHCRRCGRDRDHATSSAMVSLVAAVGIGLALYAALLVYTYLYVLAAWAV